MRQKAPFLRALVALTTCAIGLMLPQRGAAQITKTLFFEDFSGATIDPESFEPDAPFFEGGQGNIVATQAGGVVTFNGLVSEQWWAGATLRLVPTFQASEENSIVVSTDRVLEAGIGTASRSALWIMDETQTKYILFADVRGEGGWRYNRKIGEPGDVPTGGGTDIVAFNGGDYDNGQLHVMKAVADGKTVKLYLGDVLGAEVSFPYNSYVFHIGSYARANNDEAYTVFDNLRVESVGLAAFAQTALTMTTGQTSSPIEVRIPDGANATQAVVVRVVTSDPAVAAPVGAVGNTLTLTFASGAPRAQTITVESTGGTGGAQLTLESDIGLGAGNRLDVVVVEGPGIRLEDSFTGGSIDPSKWQVNDQSFEAGAGDFEVSQTGGQLRVSGYVNLDYWPGASIQSVASFTATEELPLAIEVDRVAVDPTNFWGLEPSTAVRTGVFISNADRSQFVWFGQDLGETGWQVNVNPGNPTGSGTSLTAFADKHDSLASHRLRLVADGRTVELFLDGVSGGEFPFAVSSGIHLEIGAYARAVDDQVVGLFDNAKVENIVSCIDVAPNEAWNILGEAGDEITVTVPSLLIVSDPATVTVTSQDPSVAIPQGAVNGALTLTFAVGGPTTQSFNIVPVGVGTTVFELANAEGACIGGQVNILITAAPVPVFSDDFASGQIDPAHWLVEAGALDVATPGTSTPESAVTVEAQQLKMDITAATGNWPGYNLTTVASYDASTTAPVIFEVDRAKLEFALVTGTGAKQRTGVWVSDATGANQLWFGEYATHDGTAGGWQYNVMRGLASDLPLPGAGMGIPAFTLPKYNDFGNHRMKVVADGTRVHLYLDEALGASVPFPIASGIKFGLGTHVAAGTDRVTGRYDNVVISVPGEAVGNVAAALDASGNVVISWNGSGVLQSANALTGEWTDVTPAPEGNTYTIPVGDLTAQAFFRLRSP